MSNYAPDIVIGRGKCRIEIWTEDGRIYPHTTGIVPRKVDEICNGLRGQRKKISDTIALITPELIKEVTI